MTATAAQLKTLATVRHTTKRDYEYTIYLENGNAVMTRPSTEKHGQQVMLEIAPDGRFVRPRKYRRT